MSTISYSETQEFQRDFKKLLKRFRSLEDDLELVKSAVIDLYHIQKINNLSVFPIQGVCSDQIQIYKIKKFACKALKGKGAKSGLRVICAFHVTSLRVDFLEIYYKGDKENESRDRIDAYLRGQREQA